MKKATTAVMVALATLALGASLAPAAQLLTEPFNYPNGNLVGQGGWTAHSAGGSFPAQVSGLAATLQQGAGSREDLNTPFVGQGNQATTYACFIVTVTHTAPVVAGSSDYFAHFLPTANPTFFRTRIYVVGVAAGTGDYTLGLSATSGGVTQIWPTPLAYGTSYRVVSSYNGLTGETRLWVNPTLESDFHLTDVVLAAAGENVNAYAFRQSSGVGVAQRIDNLVVSNVFEPCDQPTASEPATWGKIKATYR